MTVKRESNATIRKFLALTASSRKTRMGGPVHDGGDQCLLCSFEIEKKIIQGRDCCMYAQARDDIEPTCKVKSDMANKMSDAID